MQLSVVMHEYTELVPTHAFITWLRLVDI